MVGDFVVAMYSLVSKSAFFELYLVRYFLLHEVFTYSSAAFKATNACVSIKFYLTSIKAIAGIFCKEKFIELATLQMEVVKKFDYFWILKFLVITVLTRRGPGLLDGHQSFHLVLRCCIFTNLSRLFWIPLYGHSVSTNHCYSP